MANVDILAWLQSTVPVASGAEAVKYVLGYGDAALKKFPVASPGGILSYYKAAGNLLAADRFSGDVIASQLAGNIVWRIPTMFTLGYTPNMGTTPQLVFPFQRQGLGQIAINPAFSFGSVANQAAMLALSSPAVQVGDYCFRADDSGVAYICTALPATVNGNWTRSTGANAPVGAITVDDGDTLDPRNMNQWGAPVCLVSSTLDRWFWA